MTTYVEVYVDVWDYFLIFQLLENKMFWKLSAYFWINCWTREIEKSLRKILSQVKHTNWKF